jgi:L,D-transpeptidase YcbB
MRLLACAVAVAAIAAAACGGAKEREEVRAALQQTLASPVRPAFVTADGEGRRLWKLTQQFYVRRQHAPAWIEGNDPRPQMAELIDALTAARDEGLDPQLYNVALLKQRYDDARKGFLTRNGFNPAEAGALDAWLTYLYLKYASDLADGVSDLARADPAWRIKPERFDPAAHLDSALTSGAIRSSLMALTPATAQYQALRSVLARYREQAANGGWPIVPALRLKPNATAPQVPALARRLAASGDYAGDASSTSYGPRLQGAVKQFQRRHGLLDDGIVTPAVVAEMNVPIARRIQQIELNLERWRWLPRELGARHILVNIPEYRLEVWERERVPLAMRVVVGKPETPTPIFTEEMTHVVLSPYWNVPASIAEGETLPELLRDPGFLKRANMEVLDSSGQVVDASAIDFADPTRYRFRQRPGAANSLGLVKFMFPNEHNVYLHDTPSDSLFARVTRSFSHGCVRLEQPLALAEYVLRDHPGWSRDRIEDAMHAEEERVVKLRERLPVYLGYWTARVASDGLLQFRKDVYRIDERQAAMLSDRLMRLRKAAAAAARAAAGGKSAPRAMASSND